MPSEMMDKLAMSLVSDKLDQIFVDLVRELRTLDKTLDPKIRKRLYLKIKKIDLLSRELNLRMEGKL